MSNAEANGAMVPKKAKMSGDAANLHRDGIPPDRLSKVRVSYSICQMFNRVYVSALCR